MIDEAEHRHQLLAQHIAVSVALQVVLMRVKQGWTQDDLAQKAGVSLKFIKALERGDPALDYRMERLAKMAKAFDVALLVRYVPFSLYYPPDFEKERGRHE